MLKKNDKVALVAMSNLNTWKDNENLQKLIKIFNNWGIEVLVGRSAEGIILKPNNKASELQEYFSKKDVKYIFDISGGDSSNSTLEYIDWELIKKSQATFVGMSDLTTYLNSIYSLCNKKTIHYMIKNIFNNQKYFYDSFFLNNNFFNYKYKILKGKNIKGIVLGGNIRCLLKLAGTKYMPNFQEKILFLESLSGGKEKIQTMLYHLKHLEIFDQISGLILGEFHILEKEMKNKEVEEFFLDFFKYDLFSIIKTNELGHGRDKKMIKIGEQIEL